VIYSGGDLYEISDANGWEYIDSNVRSISAGQQGIHVYVNTNGNAYSFDDSTGNDVLLGSNVAQATAGTDRQGNYIIDLLFAGGNLQEYHADGSFASLGSGIQSISKTRAGVLDAVFSGGNAEQHTPGGSWSFLMGGAGTSV